MEDYSEVTCHLQKDVVKLINALNDRKWQDASDILDSFSNDLMDLDIWVYEQILNQQRQESGS